MNSSRKMALGIIGCGPTGAAFLLHLVDAILKKGITKHLEILIFEPNPRLPKGLAYDTKNEALILNMRTKTMSLYANELEDFARSLDLKTCTSDYLPRSIFGEYLRTTFKKTLEKARKIHLKLSFIEEEAIDIKKNGDSYEVFTPVQSRSCDQVILCLGNIPSNLYSQFKDKESYFGTPYDSNLKKITKNDVIILGSSLTAIDAALLLQKKTGKIYFVSRGGQIPKVQGPSHPYTLQKITLEKLEELKECNGGNLTLKQLIHLFKEEFKAAKLVFSSDSLKLDSLRKQNTLEDLEKNIKLAENDSLSYQKILCATSRIIPFFWNALSKSDQREFMKKYYTLWCAYRHCMPLVNAIKIRTMLRGKQLEVYGGLQKVIYSKKNRHFNATVLIDEKATQLEAPYLVNATGTGYSLKKTRSKLLKNLQRRKLVCEHPCGGIDVDFDSFECKTKSGISSPNLYSIGPLTRGVHFFTNAVEMNALHAETLAQALIRKITHV